MTVTVTESVPTAVGVPLITPVLGLMVTPAGSPVADHVKGAAPPAAAMVVEYPTPTMPFGKVGVVIERTGTITSCKEALTVEGVGFVESSTDTVNVVVPA